MRRLIPSLLSFATLAVAIGVTGLEASPAGASGAKSVRTIHRTASLGPLRTRAAKQTHAFGASFGLRRQRELTEQHAKETDEAGPAEVGRVAPSNPTRVVGAKAPSPLKVASTFNGVNALDSENVNLFNLEPPDQGLCVGNGRVLEVVNDVAAVYSVGGTALLPPIDLNTFYGYAPAFDPNTNENGPQVTDPECVYDPTTNRFYVVVLTLEADPTSPNYLGPNHLDIAVSKTGSPLGEWNVYQIPVQDDGTQGTPNHNCQPEPPVAPEITNPNACLGDYPQLAFDAHGLYVTTNEYAFFGTDFTSAQIYALPKAPLAAGDADVPLVQIDTAHMVRGTQAGFTLKPANAPGGGASKEAGGTVYFLSSNAGAEVSAVPSSSDLVVWSLSHTNTLDTSQAVRLRHRIVEVRTYGVPPRQNQKAGDIPLGDCVNDTTVPTPDGPGCWRFLFDPASEPPHDMVEGNPDALDSRMMTAWYQGGTLFGALDTAVRFAAPGGAETKAGVEWFVLNVSTSTQSLSAHLRKQGVLSVAGNNLSMPAIAVNANGDGVMGMSMMGDDYYPSAVWTAFGRKGPGKVHLVAKGVGADDGFGAYPPTFGGDTEITRWGDYAAATVVGNNLWIANEWIGQSCTFDEWLNDTTCGGTRTAFENWSTRITRVTPTS